MQPTCLETTDIFRGAFLLASGGDLVEIRVKKGGKRITTFLITGEDLDRLDRDYRCGRALVNPVQLRESLNHLRDILFAHLREHDPATRKRYAAARGRDENDRKGANRAHQAHR